MQRRRVHTSGRTRLDGVDQAFAELFLEHQIQQLQQVSLHGTQARTVSHRSSHARAKLNHGHEVSPQTHVKRTARYKSPRSNCTNLFGQRLPQRLREERNALENSFGCVCAVGVSV